MFSRHGGGISFLGARVRGVRRIGSSFSSPRMRENELEARAAHKPAACCVKRVLGLARQKKPSVWLFFGLVFGCIKADFCK